ncbi:MAG: aminotransferase class I/II-fold pyridoxal phosphate-dependent enzyme [Myxococcales bacterium]
MASEPEIAVHGGLDPEEARALGVAPESVLDLSVNLNPYGPCAPVLEAAQRAVLARYPDPSGRAACLAWARSLDVAPNRLAVGPGAADLLWTLARALVRAGDRVVIAEPTFSELRLAAAQAAAHVERFLPGPDAGHRIDLGALARAARGAQLVYLCSPNNPTGQGFAVDELEGLARALGATWLVLDQSFLSLSERARDLQRRLPDNVICVRSLTKDFALPGLRLGLLIGAPEVVQRVEQARPSWATSAPALAAIEATAAAQDFVAQSYRALRVERDRMGQLLRQAGLEVSASESVFQLVSVGAAKPFRERLLRRGVLVRDCTSFGLPAHVRVAVRSAEDTERLRRALQELGAL